MLVLLNRESTCYGVYSDTRVEYAHCLLEGIILLKFISE